MRIAWLAVLSIACGDNAINEPDGAVARCEPPAKDLPTEGQLADPLALPLPADCVVGGLPDAVGRWFFVDPESSFTFDYPQFEGDCETGFKRSFYRDDDHDLEGDGFTFHTWSDGTRLYNRYRYYFEIPNQPAFEFSSAFAACVLPDGTMAGVRGHFNNDMGVVTLPLTGKRFGLKDGPATGLTLLGSVATFGTEGRIVAYNLVIDGTFAYVVGPFGLDVIDASVPSAPVHRGHVDGGFNDVRVVRAGAKLYAFAASLMEDTVWVVDVTDPAAPLAVSTIDEYSHSLQVATVGANTFLYLANYTEFVPKFDVTDPLVPIRLGAAAVPGEVAGVHDLTVDGDRIYANNTTAGFVAFDVSGGLGTSLELGRTTASYSHASWVGTAGGRPIVLHGDEGMTGTPEGGAYLRVLDGDRSSATYMQDIGRYQSRPEVGIHNFLIAGDRAYIAYYQDGVRVVDLSDPTKPREVAHYNTWDPATAFGAAFEGALGIRVANGLIYIADSIRGLVILKES